ncbi:DUF4062 domain-containing protein [Vibrio alginolyticus]|uniref:DUF4062 domain-containing protein n=1 Tax=Vibrio TaxID=662 RepID=UPI001E3AB0C1|nr:MULTISPECIES: DUF4062 domain-containing protein [unclassified Vibrio]EGQ9765657.1 DUF4062 domain-containing protein [Vibrio alginolyticus]ELI5429570.1 DUF4062 domain-containing protein [Vibrio parahaemolyticus]ELK2038151.1 DUF4062 domain-containing protein [Vibrio vulnificus]ELK2284039.1 DUF4062 domain-containing protein [Vibrio vulnificus]MCC9653953.1 DUF4062 domain-containing protein [Vibrio sp. MA64]
MSISQSLHPSVFISSTFVDFMDERQAIADVLRSESINVNALDIQPASNNSSKSQIERGIKEADFVILLVGDRYGSILPKMTGGRRSVTHWEYLLASKKYKKHVLVFFRNSSHLTGERKLYDDADEELKEKQFKLKQFKTQLSELHNPSYFNSIAELTEKVKSSIVPAYRGIISDLNMKDSQRKARILELESEIERLKNNPFSDAMADAFKAARGEL